MKNELFSIRACPLASLGSGFSGLRRQAPPLLRSSGFAMLNHWNGATPAAPLQSLTHTYIQAIKNPDNFLQTDYL